MLRQTPANPSSRMSGGPHQALESWGALKGLLVSTAYPHGRGSTTHWRVCLLISHLSEGDERVTYTECRVRKRVRAEAGGSDG